MSPRLRGVFSDVDGTVVHYKKNLESLGYTFHGYATAANDAVAATDHGTTMPATMATSSLTISINGGESREVIVPSDSVPARLRHLPVAIWSHGTRVIPCVDVPSATLGGGYISLRTLRLVDDLRNLGVVFTLMSGARTSTYLSRRTSWTIPVADFDVCEGGGRLWALSDASSVAPLAAADAGVDEGERDALVIAIGKDSVPKVALRLDTDWLDSIAPIAGPWRGMLRQNAKERAGLLWDAYRSIEAEFGAAAPPTASIRNVKLDATSYATAFLIDLRSTGLPPEEAERAMKSIFAADIKPRTNCSVVMNLGKGHVAPTSVNKRTVTERILSRCGIVGDDCFALFDDENDLEFARLCRLGGYIPTVAHDSVLDALRSDAVGENSSGGVASSTRWRRPAVDGLLGTEEALEYLCRVAAEEARSQGPLPPRFAV